MIKKPLAFALFLFLMIMASAQQIIENPEKPLVKNAGRIIELKEIQRITDEGGEFYFKYPTQLQIASDGSIFLAEPEGEFLHFTQDGKFIKNLYKKGQGPGEISSGFRYFVRGDELLIWDSTKRKVWSADFEGNLKTEYEIANTGYSGFIGMCKDDFVFMKTAMPPPAERTGKLMEIPHVVYLAAMDGKSERPAYTFHSQEFMHPKAGRSWTPTIAVLSPDGRHIVGSYDLEYKIQVVNIEQGKIVRTFNREYPRIKHITDDFERKFNEQNGAPTMEFNPDVIGIKLGEDKVWVRTSTEDPKKGELWDIFDLNGRFLDSVYLGPGRTILRVEPDAIFVTEKNPDDTIAVVKYKIVG